MSLVPSRMIADIPPEAAISLTSNVPRTFTGLVAHAWFGENDSSGSITSTDDEGNMG